MRWAIPIALLLCGGCVSHPVYVATQLELPPVPELPTLASEDETACLSDEAFKTLVRREARLKGHIYVLRTIIEEHNRGTGREQE